MLLTYIFVPRHLIELSECFYKFWGIDFLPFLGGIFKALKNEQDRIEDKARLHTNQKGVTTI